MNPTDMEFGPELPTREEVDMAEVQALLSGIEHLSIVPVIDSADEAIEPNGYFKWIVGINDDEPVSGNPAETPTGALLDYLEWTTRWIRQEFQ